MRMVTICSALCSEERFSTSCYPLSLCVATPIRLYWCGRRDSNPHSHREADFLTTSAFAAACRRSWSGLSLRHSLSAESATRPVSTPSLLQGLGSGLAWGLSPLAFPDFERFYSADFPAGTPIEVCCVYRFRHVRISYWRHSTRRRAIVYFQAHSDRWLLIGSWAMRRFTYLPISTLASFYFCPQNALQRNFADSREKEFLTQALLIALTAAATCLGPPTQAKDRLAFAYCRSPMSRSVGRREQGDRSKAGRGSSQRFPTG